MRLIDADELLERLKKTDRYFLIKFDIEESQTIFIRCFECGNNYCRASLEGKDCPVLKVVMNNEKTNTNG